MTTEKEYNEKILEQILDLNDSLIEILVELTKLMSLVNKRKKLADENIKSGSESILQSKN